MCFAILRDKLVQYLRRNVNVPIRRNIILLTGLKFYLLQLSRKSNEYNYPLDGSRFAALNLGMQKESYFN